MKKFLIILLAMVLVLILMSACGRNNNKPAEWPDNEFTQMIPKPDFNLFLADTNDNIFTAIYRDVTLEQIKAYTEAVKTAGFTVNPGLDETTTYKYTASNGKGYSIELTRYTGNDQTVYLKIIKE